MSIFNYREQPGYFQRLKDALKSTQQDLTRKIDTLLGTAESPVTEEQLEELESVLIAADIGVKTTVEITERIRELTKGDRYVTSTQVKRLIREELLEILKGAGESEANETIPPLEVVLVVGVNGVGKTTTIGKLAHLYRQQGREVMICASDTFRAAAVEQLVIWAERTGSDIVKQGAGADPAAVLFDAIAACKARGKDVLIVDTAGRLHTKTNLMQELEKMNRIAAREVEGAPHRNYLVLDATTGQNGLVQAREFLKAVNLNGLIVTKLDGTAKGGVVLSIVRELGLPIRFIGTGEKVEDLLVFSSDAFLDSLLGETGVRA